MERRKDMENVFVATEHGIGMHDWEDHRASVVGVFFSCEKAIEILIAELETKGFEPEYVEEDATSKIKYIDKEEDMNCVITIEEHRVQ